MKIKELINFLKTFDEESPIGFTLCTLWLTEDVKYACEAEGINFNDLNKEDIEDILSDMGSQEISDLDWNTLNYLIQEKIDFNQIMKHLEKDILDFSDDFLD